MNGQRRQFEVLDALRGLCAIVVVILHFSENYCTSWGESRILPHGCLPVEFFFALTGFMLIYAYDGRWGEMSVVGFFKRRLVRLHPLIVFASVVGAACYLLSAEQYSRLIPGGTLSLGQLVLLTLWCCTLLPAPRACGWILMHPLQGPLWTMFYIYLANVLYALVFRHLKTKILMIFALLSIVMTFWFGIQGGGFHYGPSWTWTHWQKTGLSGFLCGANLGALGRMAFPLFAGMVIARKGWKIETGRSGLLICSVLLLAIFCAPSLRPEYPIANGLFEATAVVVGMPLVLLCGIGGEIHCEKLAGVCRFLGKFSFPLYTTHYSMTMIERVWRDSHASAPWEMHFAVSVACAFLAVLNAVVAMRFADWFSAKFGKR